MPRYSIILLLLALVPAPTRGFAQAPGAPCPFTFHVGTLNRDYQRSTPTVGTYAIIASSRQQGAEAKSTALRALRDPGGRSLLPPSSQATIFQTLFSVYSQAEPMAGNYLAVLEQDAQEFSCRAPLDPKRILPTVGDARVRRLLGKDVNRLIVEWDPLPGALAYDVEIGSEGEVLAERTIAGGGQRASWDDLPLERGREYRVVIRAFAFPFHSAPDEPLDLTSLPDQTDVSERGLFFEAQ